MKKQLSLAMAGVMALSLAACGGSSASSAATSTAEAASSTAESTAESTAAEGDVLDQAAAAAFAQDVTLTMWGAEEDQDLLREISDKFIEKNGNYGGKITDYEGNHKVPGPIVPMIAIPTTAGTGSEVTASAVITDTERNYKLSVFSYEILPKYAVLDPELIMTAPASIAASCGVDALIHAMEAYVSRNATPFSDAMAEKAMELIGGNLRRFVANRQDEEAACAMMLGSNFAGISFAWARLGNVHAMSHPVSAYFNVPHGVANSILLPNVVEYNALADHGRYEVIYNYIREGNGPIENFTPDMLVEELRHLNEQLGIPATLSEVGVTADKIPAMAEDAMKSGNIPANPRQSTVKDIIKLYEKTM